jgi:hypothetical protein
LAPDTTTRRQRVVFFTHGPAERGSRARNIRPT